LAGSGPVSCGAALPRFAPFAGWRLTGKLRSTGRLFVRGKKNVRGERFSFTIKIPPC
jgi:hypothetical protein